MGELGSKGPRARSGRIGRRSRTFGMRGHDLPVAEGAHAARQGKKGLGMAARFIARGMLGGPRSN